MFNHVVVGAFVHFPPPIASAANDIKSLQDFLSSFAMKKYNVPIFWVNAIKREEQALQAKTKR